MMCLRLGRAAALLSALALGSCTSATSTPITTRLELRDGMRELWTSHVTWTRIFLITSVADLPDHTAATARLLENQVDLGDAIRPFYGDAAGARLTALLQEHITGAAALLDAARGGDAAAIAAARDGWYANADDIAHFFADANPHLAFADLQTLMRAHLDQTLASATARLGGAWADDIAAYDVIVAHAEHMADVLAAGIATQFPELVGPTAMSTRDEDLHVAMRSLWQAHVTWTRVYLVVALAGLPDAPLTAERLLRNQDDLGNAIRPFYGDAAGDQLTRLLRAHIEGAVEVVAAAAAEDDARRDAARTAWYGNADDIASFLASANPRWAVATLRATMRAHLDHTLAEATARLGGEWSADVAAYDEVVVHILSMSDELSSGISAQFP